VRKQVASGNDFPIYWSAARTILAGESPYGAERGLHGYVYPPFLALAVAPLAALPLAAAAGLWYAINLALILASLRAAQRALATGLPSAAARWALPAAAVGLGGVFADNLALGQANLALLALTVTAVLWLLDGRRERGAGALLGVACCIKMYPALLLLPALLRGRWRAALGFAAGLLVAGVLLPAAVLGPKPAAARMREWRAQVVAPTLSGTLQGSVIWDQSPQAALRRLTVAEPAFDDVSVNVASVSAGTYRRASRAMGAGFLALVILLWVGGPARNSKGSYLTDLALAYCLTLLVVGYNLKAHFVALLFPAALAAGTPGAGFPRAAILGVGATLLALSNPGLVGRALSNWALAYSCLTFFTLLVTAVLAARRLRPPVAGSR
jgi:alpha-1,2-mannosyltransferase